MLTTAIPTSSTSVLGETFSPSIVDSSTSVREENAKHSSLLQSQPYHLVTASPWPLLLSYSILVLAFSGVLYFTGYKIPLFNTGLELVVVGVLITVHTISLWFRDVTAEGTYLGDHTGVVQEGLNLGFILFVVSEAFFFLSIFWAYMHSSLSPTVELGSYWPPFSISSVNPYELPLVNTLLLLSSGVTVTFSHHALIKEQRRYALLGLVATLVLSVVFTACQGVEYKNTGFSLSDSVYGSSFFFSTGFHGAHVLLGTTFLAVGLYRIYGYHLTSTHHVGYEAAIIYWHFVDFVWILLFTLVYWWAY